MKLGIDRLDFECFTILRQTDVTGLQVQNRKGDCKLSPVLAQLISRDRCKLYPRHFRHQYRRPICQMDEWVN